MLIKAINARRFPGLAGASRSSSQPSIFPMFSKDIVLHILNACEHAALHILSLGIANAIGSIMTGQFFVYKALRRPSCLCDVVLSVATYLTNTPGPFIAP